MSQATRRKPQTLRATAGPWVGVRTTVDPADDPPNLLVDAQNLYIPDPTGASGAYARPGFALLNNGDPLVTSLAAFRGQGIFSFTSVAGVTTNFVVIKGTLFRVEGQLASFVDVTPVGVTIDDGITVRVYGTTFGNQFIVTDGVNPPWLLTNPTSTPVTATPIAFNAASDPWSAYGPAVVYGGAVFFIINDVDGVSARTDIAWSIVGDAAEGYQQADFDNRWTLLQTATDPLFALAGTNVALYYWRSASIGAIAGAVGPNLATSATHDAVAVNVGTQMPQSIVQFGNWIYFTDELGRPYRMAIGGQPEAIWLQLRGIVDASTSGFPGVTKRTTTASFEPTLNLYVVAIWSPIASQQAPAVEAYAFDARTGIYMGRWTIGPGVQLDTLGNLPDANGRGVLVVLGSKLAPTGSTTVAGGYVWAMNGLVAVGDLLTTEDTPPVFLTTEDGVQLTTEGSSGNWLDNDVAPVRSATTTRIGYASDRVLNVDRATALTGSTSPCTIAMQTANVAQTTEGTPTASAAKDRIYRLIVGANQIQGRGLEVAVSPTTADAQWSLQSVTVEAIVSVAGPEEN